MIKFLLLTLTLAQFTCNAFDLTTRERCIVVLLKKLRTPFPTLKKPLEQSSYVDCEIMMSEMSQYGYDNNCTKILNTPHTRVLYEKILNELENRCKEIYAKDGETWEWRRGRWFHPCLPEARTTSKKWRRVWKKLNDDNYTPLLDFSKNPQKRRIENAGKKLL